MGQAATPAKPKETKPERTTLWFDKELKQLADTIATLEPGDKCANDVVEEECRAGLKKRHERAIKRAAAELGRES